MNISVGILSADRILCNLLHPFYFTDTGAMMEGKIEIYKENEYIYLVYQGEKKKVDLPVILSPMDLQKAVFELEQVVIGIEFHWERKENQRFKGSLKIIEENGKLYAVNLIDIEDYLLSVISSEMSSTSSLELLKAHAVISRSWLLAQKEKAAELQEYSGKYQSFVQTESEYIRWYDREDHINFDVCADDHCQRYQGIQKVTTPIVQDAIQQTKGVVLKYQGKYCDTRFSKCCGGISERFENVWEPVKHDYLTNIVDGIHICSRNVSEETKATAWINSSPDVFCNTTDRKILSEVLNDYDQETHQFFRWKIKYSQEEISSLVFKRIGIDCGLITDLIPVERGPSGRLIRLKIVGTQKSMIIGKELVIRKALSESHLYSSAFTVKKVMEGDQIKEFILHGAGWGHGVGLCQIGAAVMGAEGYSYQEILEHYFRGAEICEGY